MKNESYLSPEEGFAISEIHMLDGYGVETVFTGVQGTSTYEITETKNRLKIDVSFTDICRRHSIIEETMVATLWECSGCHKQYMGYMSTKQPCPECKRGLDEVRQIPMLAGM